MKNLTMMTDFYELTMSQAYFAAGKKDEIAVFDAFFRKNPQGGGYGVMGGVDRIIDFISKTKNPYIFKVNGRLVKIEFCNNGKKAEDSITSVIKSIYK